MEKQFKTAKLQKEWLTIREKHQCIQNVYLEFYFDNFKTGENIPPEFRSSLKNSIITSILGDLNNDFEIPGHPTFSKEILNNLKASGKVQLIYARYGKRSHRSTICEMGKGYH